MINRLAKKKLPTPQAEHPLVRQTVSPYPMYGIVFSLTLYAVTILRHLVDRRKETCLSSCPVGMPSK